MVEQAVKDAEVNAEENSKYVYLYLHTHAIQKQQKQRKIERWLFASIKLLHNGTYVCTYISYIANVLGWKSFVDEPNKTFRVHHS